ncbi:MAG: T9SS type A sorting domain-containing protein [Candidatus Eisenbacteria sp.]|nr:T9SS type A sorting domain-containing protein [Candidatus Eisenbacteria bacterium]
MAVKIGASALTTGLLLLVSVLAPAWVSAGSWQAVPWTGCDALTVFFHPTNAETCYAGSMPCGEMPEGVHRSTDRGATWAALGIPATAVSLAVNPLNTQRMYRTEDGGHYRTGNGGDMWRRKMDGIAYTGYMTFVVVNYAYPETVYTGVGTFFGDATVYRSFDHAQNWHAMTIPAHPNRYRPGAFAVHPKDPSILYVTMDSELLVSDNHGEAGSWHTLLGEFEYAQFSDIAIDPVNPARTYVASEGAAGRGGVYRSTDGGENWDLLGAAEGLTSTMVKVVAVDPLNPSTVYAGTRNSATPVFISTDGGDSWIAFDAGLPVDCDINDLAVDWETGNVVLAATSDGIYRYDYTTDVADGPFTPRRFALEQNRPNPFNPNTVIRFSIGAESHVTLGVYDIRGRLIRTLVEEVAAVGEHQSLWDGKDEGGVEVASGVYFCRLEAGEFSDTMKIILMK